MTGEGCWTSSSSLSSFKVLYLPAAAVPGCVRACGGVRRGDAPRSGGVGLGLVGLCCCLKNGLSKRPGGRGRGEARHTNIPNNTKRTEVTEDTMTRKQNGETRGVKRKRVRETGGARTQDVQPQRIVGKAEGETWRRTFRTSQSESNQKK